MQQILSSFLFLGPLEQFQVIAIPALAHGVSLVNSINLIIGLNLLLIMLIFALFNLNQSNNYDFGLSSAYSLIVAVVRENLFIKKQQYFTVIFYLFLTLLLANLIGLLPYSFTVTSSFIFTLFLSLIHFLAINGIGVYRHGWQINNLFLPAGAPLAIIPFLIFIEFVSYIARVLSLSIRLFANMMSGHALLKILIGFSWALLGAGAVIIFIAIFPWAIVTAVIFLELLIAFLQAYVFALLITLYTNDVLTFHD